MITGHAAFGGTPRSIVGLYAALLLAGAGLLAAAIMMVIWPTAGTLTNASGFQAGHDFVAFYAAGRFVASGPPLKPERHWWQFWKRGSKVSPSKPPDTIA